MGWHWFLKTANDSMQALQTAKIKTAPFDAERTGMRI